MINKIRAGAENQVNDHGFLHDQLFVAVVAEEGSFSRAARRLRTSQSVVTKRIADVEEKLGVKLFERTTRKCTLTAAGKAILPEIQASIRHSERARDLGMYYGRIGKGPIRLGYSPFIYSALLRVLHRLNVAELEQRQSGTQETPSPRLILENGTTPELVECVLRGRLQVAVGVLPIEDRDLWVEIVGSETLCLCVPKSNPLASRPSIAARDLHGQVLYWIPRNAHPGFHDHVVEYIHSTGARPIYQEVSSYSHAFEIVAFGSGLALLPGSAGRLSHSGVTFKPVTDRYLEIQTALFARRDMAHGEFRQLTHFLVSQLRPQKVSA